MHTLMILGIIFGSIILMLMVIGGTILMGIRIIKGGGVSHKSQKLHAEETKMIQEIYQGISRMETRIDALETILFDKDRKERSL